MAGLGRKVFEANEVLTAADVNGYLMDQTVMVFDDATARDAAITAPTEGMLSYQKDTDAITKYTGSGWISIAVDLNTTADRVIITDGNGDLAVSDVTSTELTVLDGITATTTELNYTDGVTSNIQTQLNTLDSDKADLSGANFSGRVTASDNDESRFSVRNIYISTADPSGGVDGDVWLKYE